MAGASVIEEYLSQLAVQLGRHDRDGDLLAEARSHLRDEAARLEASGLSRAAAEAMAVADFGSPRVVARLHRRGGRAGVPTVFSRAGGGALAAGSAMTAVFVAAELSDPAGSQAPYPAIGASGVLLILLGLVGLHVRQRSSSPTSGSVGIVLLALGALTAPLGGWGPLGPLPVVPLAIGTVLLVVATFRAGYVPKSTLWIILGGGVATLVNWGLGGFTDQNVLDAVPFAVMLFGVTWMGSLLLSERISDYGAAGGLSTTG